MAWQNHCALPFPSMYQFHSWIIKKSLDSYWIAYFFVSYHFPTISRNSKKKQQHWAKATAACNTSGGGGKWPIEAWQSSSMTIGWFGVPPWIGNLHCGILWVYQWDINRISMEYHGISMFNNKYRLRRHISNKLGILKKTHYIILDNLKG